MKKLLPFAVVGLCFILCHLTAVANDYPNTVSYSEFQGHTVYLQFDPEVKHLALMVRADDVAGGGTGAEQLEFLRKEVIRLTSTTNTVQLGTSGVYFHYHGGNPIWQPYKISSKSGILQCLIFAKGDAISMKGNLIEVKGVSTVASEHYSDTKIADK